MNIAGHITALVAIECDMQQYNNNSSILSIYWSPNRYDFEDLMQHINVRWLFNNPHYKIHFIFTDQYDFTVNILP